MEYKKITLFCLLMIGIFTSTSCKDEGTGWTPDMIPDDEVEVPDYDEEVDISNIHKFKAPLYWSVYEFCMEMADNGIPEYQMVMICFVRMDLFLCFVKRTNTATWTNMVACI